MIGNFLKSWTITNYVSNSTGSSVSDRLVIPNLWNNVPPFHIGTPYHHDYVAILIQTDIRVSFQRHNQITLSPSHQPQTYRGSSFYVGWTRGTPTCVNSLLPYYQGRSIMFSVHPDAEFNPPGIHPFSQLGIHPSLSGNPKCGGVPIWSHKILLVSYLCWSCHIAKGRLLSS